MLKGIDVSGWQNSMSFNGNDFVILKASEGGNYKDPMLDKHYNNIVASNIKCYGFYHYARPDNGNSPEKEADFFLSLVGHHAGKCLYVLDWEQKSLDYSTDWALRWLRRVHLKTGVKPLIYIQASQEWNGNYNNIRNEDYGLWVAHWGVNSPTIKNWKEWALWQYTDKPYDTNYFNGDVDTWFRYCKGSKQPPKPSQPKYNLVSQHGVCTINVDTLNIREEPSTKSNIVGSYHKNEQVNYDYYVDNEGYRWISWVGNSGKRRYMAVRILSNNQRYGICR